MILLMLARSPRDRCITHVNSLLQDVDWSWRFLYRLKLRFIYLPVMQQRFFYKKTILCV
jgi:hypothetical protein